MDGHYSLISRSAAWWRPPNRRADQITVAAGRPVGEAPATAVLVRPDGYVAWASSAATPGADELRALRAALTPVVRHFSCYFELTSS